MQYFTKTGFFIFGFVALFLFNRPVSAVAPLMVVNDVGNDSDFSTADERCDIDNNAGNGDQCTLRAAIEQINALNGSRGDVTIHFDLPGTPPYTIQPIGTPLPTINQTTFIDATAGANSLCPTPFEAAKIVVKLDGAALGVATNGLILGAGSDGSLVKGLAITNFGREGLVISSDDNVVQCNFIGVDTDGKSPLPNVGGIHISSEDNLIGGNHETLRNLISGNSADGIYFASTAERNDIHGNIIGLTEDMSQVAANTGAGIYFFGADNNNIGGISADLGNIISGNNSFGIFLNDAGTNTSRQNDIYNNKIGTNLNGDTGLGNGNSGIRGDEADSNTIGSSAGGGSGNEIAGNNSYGVYFATASTNNAIRFNQIHDNTLDGVKILNSDDQFITNNAIWDNGDAGIDIANGAGVSTGNTVSQNSIYNNGDLGIDLVGDDAVEPNDTGDGDSGPNNLQNYPDLSLVGKDGIAVGSLNSLANTPFTLEFYKNATCDSSGHGEGETYLGELDVTTDGSGNAHFTTAFFVDVAVGDHVTALATNGITGDSSEFSACSVVEDALIINHAGDSGDDVAGNGTCNVNAGTVNVICTLRAAIEEVNALNAPSTTVYFAIAGAGPHTITPANLLPAIQDPIILDGLTHQQGADCTTGLSIFLDGTALGVSIMDGLAIFDAEGTLIQGLAVGNFPDNGIYAQSDEVTIRCNYLGLQADGTTIAPNRKGFYSFHQNLKIGEQNYPNFMSGNTENGIHVVGVPLSAGINLAHNFVGLDITLDADAGNGSDGILLDNIIDSDIINNYVSGNNAHGVHILNSDNLNLQNNVVGVNGTADDPIRNLEDGLHMDNVHNSIIRSNVFSGHTLGSGVQLHDSSDIVLTLNRIGVGGNPSIIDIIPNVDGIQIDGNSRDITIGGDPGADFNFIGGNNGAGIFIHFSDDIAILGNEIGTTVGGVDTGNGTYGILTLGADDIQIGAHGMGNTIAHSGGAGVLVANNGQRNHIVGNAIYGNSALGIDLNLDGMDTPDVDDVDGGANGTQNFPDIDFASLMGGGLGVSGTFLPGNAAPYNFDFYSLALSNPTSSAYLGSLSLSAVATNFFAEVAAPPSGDNVIRIIATDNAGNSSEFSGIHGYGPSCNQPATIHPAISVVGNDIQLNWNQSSVNYIYRSVNDPYGEKLAYGYSNGPASWLDNNTVGDVANNYYYHSRLNALACASEPSQTVGEFDFAIVPGTP